jgi:hypothetical protein
MKLHRNAALSWNGRRLLAERVVVRGWTLTAAAEAAGVSLRCARKWVGRYRLEGEQGLHDRSSAPRRVVHIDVKRLGRIQGGAGKRIGGEGTSPYNLQLTDAEGVRRKTVGREYVHIAIDDHSRLAYAEVLPDEKAVTAIAFLRLPRDDPRDRVQDPRHPPPPHPALPATDQRQSRTLHPHPPRRLGLRRHLPLKPRTHRRP